MLFFKNLTKIYPPSVWRTYLLLFRFKRNESGGNDCLPWAEKSIKKSKLCKTNPISGTPKMNPTNYMTKAYDNNSPLLKVQKRSQNEPNQTQSYRYSVWRANPILPLLRLAGLSAGVYPPPAESGIEYPVSGIESHPRTFAFSLLPFYFPFSLRTPNPVILSKKNWSVWVGKLSRLFRLLP